MTLEAFDIYAYLDSQNIHYKESGKNIGRNFLGVCCPFCGDSSYHLGINKRTKGMTCWKCGRKNLLQFVQEIENVSKREAYTIIEKFQDKELSYLDIPDRIPTENDVQLPKGCTKNFPGLAIDYLEQRNFDPEELIKTYNLYYGQITTNFQHRIIVPVYYKRELISYVGRDVTGKLQNKYRNSSIEESKIPVKDTLFNLDTVKDKVIIVEGVFDVFRLGRGTVATFGTKYKKEQIAKLIGVKQAFILFDADDPDAPEQAERMGKDLTCFVDHVEQVTLQEGDPANLTPTDALKLKKYLGF